MSNKTKLKIIPLGGLEAIGMNITAFEYEDSIIVVDCGLAFPEDDMYGIDLVIPDITYLLENADKVKGFVFTHGHEDHIGALPYILKQLNVPIYATKLTMGLIELKLNEHELMKTTRRKVIQPGQSINLGQFRVEFIKTNHSIQDAVALAIYSPAGTIVHTGDFKVDFTPVFGDAIDLQRFAEIGRKGVLALMCDSTNAERPGYTPSERTVGRAFDTIFSEHRNSRLIIATFASNVDRVQQIIDTAYKYGRKVIVEGRSMVNVISTAEELGYISIPENTLITLEEMRNYPDEKLVLSVWGSLGAEHMNKVMAELMEKLDGGQRFRLVHAAGKLYYPRLTERFREKNLDRAGVEIREYIHNDDFGAELYGKARGHGTVAQRDEQPPGEKCPRARTCRRREGPAGGRI